MIGTIGSLVQETSTRWRWLRATSLYIAACVTTASLLGALLGAFGLLARRALCSVAGCASGGTPTTIGIAGAVLLSVLAVAYAASDLGLLRLPRPKLMNAVPVTWWRWWRPYGASIAYGAALGLGITTFIPFGAFYVLCAWCVLHGNIAYGAVLLGTYGAARALTLIPASVGVYRDRIGCDERIERIYAQLEFMRRMLAAASVLFSAQLVFSAVFSAVL